MTKKENTVDYVSDMEMPTADDEPFYIVAIGASAGGLEPLQQFFSCTPEHSGCAYVVVQHLSPDFDSQMKPLLQRKTNMPVQVVTHGMQIEKNNVYLIPPKKIMGLCDGKFSLVEKDATNGVPLPIDIFFSALASDAGAKSIGIVLSGTGSDGSHGIIDIASAGGLVVVQAADSAAFDGMPINSIATGVVNITTEPQLMPAILARYVDKQLTPDSFNEMKIGPYEELVSEIFNLLNKTYGIDFSDYKGATVGRRISRRVQLTHSGNHDEYLALVKTSNEELENLYKDLLIGVTKFFRDAKVFEVLENKIIPELIEKLPDGKAVRVWCAGCATGEEAYSIAILLHEAMTRAGRMANFKIFATDVHKESIISAGAGVFDKEALVNVSPERLEKYFDKAYEGYQVNQNIRGFLSFAKHNLINDAPFTRMDMISCRNMLIYLQPQAQQKVLALFHFGLRLDGVLLLGASESLGEIKSEFTDIDERCRIFRKSRDKRLPHSVPLPMGRVDFTQQMGSGQSYRGLTSSERALTSVYEQLLEQHLPAAFVLNENLELVHTFAGGERFLQMVKGRASLKLLDMVSEELKPILSGAVKDAAQQNRIVTYTGVRLRKEDGSTASHQLVVQPIHEKRSRSHYMVVKIWEQSKPLNEKDLEGDAVNIDNISQHMIKTLEDELRFSQENLQTTVEELETANEEMQASNEELVASNEELQSTNEELQSVNEELFTVNSELQEHVRRLQESNDDMDNLLATTRVGVVFLDDSMKIRRFTPEICKIFHFQAIDIGRSIRGFAHTLECDDFIGQIHKVLETGNEFESNVIDRDGAPYLLRMLPYHASFNLKPTGVVITFVDTSSIKAAQNEVARFKEMINLTSDYNAVVNFDGSFDYVNPALLSALGYEKKQLEKLSFNDIAVGYDRIKFAELTEKAISKSNELLEAKFKRSDSSIFSVELTVTEIVIKEKQSKQFFFTARDITTRQETQARLNLRNQALQSTLNGIILSDRYGEKITFVNRAFTKLTGYSETEVIGRSCNLLQGEETDKSVVNEIREAIKTQSSIRRPILNYKKDGTKFWNDLQIAPVSNDDGEPVGFVGVVNDFTNLREAERKAQQYSDRITLLLDSTEEGIYGLDNKGMCTFINKSAVETLGYSEVKELIGQELHDIIHRLHEDGAAYDLKACPIYSSFKTKKKTHSDKDVFWRKDGTSFPVEYWSHPTLDKEGNVTGAVVTFLDITERKRDREQIVLMQQMAEAANQTKTVFLANMSHELRTPLASILGFAEILDTSDVGEKEKSQIGTIKRNGLYLLDLLDDLLDISRIDTGNLSIDFEDCSLAEIIMDVESNTAYKAEQKNLKFTLTMLSEIPEVINTDSVRLTQILCNLIGNAIKFTKKGYVDCQIRVNSDSSLLEFKIIDTGAGISPSLGSEIFEPFNRGEEAKNGFVPGSGLGLSISQQLAGKLGGEITYQSKVGQGSEFVFTLPVSLSGALISNAALMRMRRREEQTIYPQMDLTVLLVDDSDDIRSFMNNLLSRCGMTVYQAIDGLKAISTYESCVSNGVNIDLILMDMQMPNMSGYDSVIALRKLGCESKIMAITANAMKGSREQCLSAGCDEFLTKPVNAKNFVRKVVELMETDGCLDNSENRTQTTELVEPKTILVVDDNMDISSALQQLLAGYGYKSDVAFTEDQALEKIKQNRPDVVLLDLNLSETSGFELYEKMYDLDASREISVIATTGFSDKKTKDRALQLGFDAYLTKPIPMAVLVDTMQEVFSAKKMKNMSSLECAE